MSRKKSINTSNYKVHNYPGSVMFIHIACLWMCVLFYFSFVCLHVCAYAFKFKVDFGSAFEPGTSGLPYCCTPPVCVPAEIGELPVWRHNQKKKKLNVAGVVPVDWASIEWWVGSQEKGQQNCFVRRRWLAAEKVVRYRWFGANKSIRFNKNLSRHWPLVGKFTRCSS